MQSEEPEEALGRYSLCGIATILQLEETVTSIHPSTLCRWFGNDALPPWPYQSWLFPRDSAFVAKATVVLDLYHGFWQGEVLGADDCVLSADEKSGLQGLYFNKGTLRRHNPSDCIILGSNNSGN